MEYKFKKVHTGKDLAISGIIIAAGIGLYFLNAGLGCVILFCWVMMLPFWHPGYRITGREGVFTLEEILVARECRDWPGFTSISGPVPSKLRGLARASGVWRASPRRSPEAEGGSRSEAGAGEACSNKKEKVWRAARLSVLWSIGESNS